MSTPIKVAVFSTKPYDKHYLQAACPPESNIQLTFHPVPLTPETASLVTKASADAVCVFVNDHLPSPVLSHLASSGVRAILLRCAGSNNVDLPAAQALGLSVANVPAYSPEAVAEFAVALLQTLNRQTHRAHARVREGNFSLDGLMGRTLRGKTVGLIGTGRIGVAFARIMSAGFGCRVLAHDPFRNPAFEPYGSYVDDLAALLPQCDVLSLHCPLTESTKHVINADTLALLPDRAILVNTSRGGLVDTKALIHALKARKLAGVALDVYEGEGSLFYDDHSGEIIQDDVLMRLLTFPNVIVCGHQAFFAEEALREIADCTVRNLQDIMARRPCENALVSPDSSQGGEENRRSEVKRIRSDSLPVRTV
ncbi:D-lactate dehydrogenase [Sodiomyces alkalinus F11]|uniref:D-lactate dehydrogenase n=1 Tax=Sodiomyces alkalinus (strain CBS 110278 / VKM F-3762 / F11) TaxID=1314773 RepID=A0A3N2PRL6_SODAK|nr:D-lactate dehydrogenase [Sodiomyces alkalinus F11]ROT37161.1 D-lactate dehydrogenase [Sodiomyces alkalinus F11]